MPSLVKNQELSSYFASSKYDAVNNPTGILDLRSAAEWPAGAKPVSRGYDYDELRRVKHATYDSGGDFQVSPFLAEDALSSSNRVPMTCLGFRLRRLNNCSRQRFETPTSEARDERTPYLRRFHENG